MINREERVRVKDWFSFSHWGMFALGIFTAPAWFVGSRYDDELVEFLELDDA